MRARAILNGGESRESRAAAILLCERAMESAPDGAQVLWSLSLIIASKYCGTVERDTRG